MAGYELHELMVSRVAAEVDGVGAVVMASFTPLAYAAYMLAKRTHAPDALLVGYDGVGMEAIPLSFTGSEAAIYSGAVARWSLLQGAHAIQLANRGGVEAISPVQLDGEGRVNISVIGPHKNPKVRLPGGAGAAEIIQAVRKMVVYQPRHSKRTLVDAVDFSTGARGRIGNAARRKANLSPGPIVLITDLAVLVKDDEARPFRIRSLHPGVEVQHVVDATGFELDLAHATAITPVPTAEELRVLREEVDPFGTARLDFFSGEQRIDYLKGLLLREWEQGVAAAGMAERMPPAYLD